MNENSNPLSIGWKEWGGLPDLGIDRIHMKVDTGAKTSSLHVLEQQVFEREGHLWVRFTTQPHQDHEDTLACEAPVKDHRVVTNSGGDGQSRVVIETTLVLGGQHRTIELTLANRSKMKFRMLLGRQAMGGITVKPDQAHLSS